MKVAIIGAGICGLYLAWKLSEKGHNVTVFEKRERIGKDVCSGLISERIIDFIPGSLALVKNKIDSVLIHFPNKTLNVKFANKFLIMDHSELDNLAAGLARAAGANIAVNSPISVFPEGFDRIIGCDGAMSWVRKNLGEKEPAFYSGIRGFGVKKPLAAAGDEAQYHFVETWPTKSGFLWKIPRGGPRARTSSVRGGDIEYGVMDAPKSAKDIFDSFIKEKKIAIERTDAAIISQGLIIPNNQKITLCGEAAGMTKPWSGGGVIWGLTAADILLKNFPDFLKYKERAERLFLREIIFSKIAKKMLYFFGFNFSWLLPKNFKIDGDFYLTK